MRRVVLLLVSFGLLSATPAHAAGGPVPPAFGGAGVSVPGGHENVVALYAGAGRTVLTRIRKDDGTVARSRVIDGVFGVPGVSYDGINTGLSADGSTLVLANPGATRRTRLRVFDARSLRARRDITLRGMNTVDAISPDGRWLYLVDYKDGLASSYDVRAYDLERGRLLSKPIVDPREPEEKLQGVPVTRVSSDDGRWAYTLYSGEEPFIHALDTEGRTAVCIDLPASVNTDPSGVHLKLDGTTLTVAGSEPHAVVDLKTFKVSEPAPAAARPKPAATPKPAPATDSGPSVVLWLLPLVALGAVALLARQRRAATRSHAASGHSG